MNYGYLSYVGDDEQDGLTSSQRRLIKKAGGPRRPVSRSYAGQVVDRLIYQELIAPGKPAPARPSPAKVLVKREPLQAKKSRGKRKRPQKTPWELLLKAVDQFNLDGNLAAMTNAYIHWQETRWADGPIGQCR